MTSSDFVHRFEEFVGASGWRTVASPAQLVQQWDDFVKACENGYKWSIYEYENDRSVRDLLDSALTDPVLSRYSELAQIGATVEAIDSRFRRVTRDDVQIGPDDSPWWQRRVLRFAGETYINDVRSLYDVEVARSQPRSRGA